MAVAWDMLAQPCPRQRAALCADNHVSGLFRHAGDDKRSAPRLRYSTNILPVDIATVNSKVSLGVRRGRIVSLDIGLRKGLIGRSSRPADHHEEYIENKKSDRDVVKKCRVT